MLQKPTNEIMGPILLSRSQEDSSKIKSSGDLLRNSSRTEVMGNGKNCQRKSCYNCKKINFEMLQKATYETMGPILLSRSQGDCSKIKNSRDLLRNSSRTEDMKKNLPKKKLLHLYKKINFGILQNQRYETMGPILLSRSQNDSAKIKIGEIYC